LRESEKKFSSIVEASPMGMVLFHLNEKEELVLVDSNPAASKILGVDKSDYMGKTLEAALPTLNSSVLPLSLMRVAKEGISIKLDEREYKEDKINGFFDLYGFQISPGNMVIMFMDVTERKEMIQAIKSSEKRLKILFESAPDAIFLYNSKGIFLDGNKAAENYIGYKKEELIGKSFMKFNLIKLKDIPRVAKILRNNALGKGTEPNELEILRKDGSTIVLEVRAYPVVIDNKQVFLGIARDMTERKKIETKMRLNLEEKETLLKELYHRTKNNMQIISAMLSLQSRRSENEYIGSSFKEIINKINAMSMVHEKLYHSKDLSRINLKDYLQDLVALLRKSLGYETGKISSRFELEDVFLAIDTAIPLGLVINELITNAFKHAFKNNNNYELFIKLRRNTKGTVKLFIGDNGSGIPADMDLRRSNSMGLQTVFALIEYQIKGKISYENKNGLQWYIEFKDIYTKRV
jgi:PAS domain S-box-containing protein